MMKRLHLPRNLSGLLLTLFFGYIVYTMITGRTNAPPALSIDTLIPRFWRPELSVFIDAGHGGDDPGAVRAMEDGSLLREADINLAIALKTRDLLQAKGIRVAMSRATDAGVGSNDDSGDGPLGQRAALQRVVDMANESKAALFLSIHSNGSPDSRIGGSEVYYCADRTFAHENERLARLVQANLMYALKEVGYRPVNRGVKEDKTLYSGRAHLFVLGPPDLSRRPRATDMPGVLVEPLFITNPTESRLLASEDVQAAIARAYSHAISMYFDGKYIGE